VANSVEPAAFADGFRLADENPGAAVGIERTRLTRRLVRAILETMRFTSYGAFTIPRGENGCIPRRQSDFWDLVAEEQPELEATTEKREAVSADSAGRDRSGAWSMTALAFTLRLRAIVLCAAEIPPESMIALALPSETEQVNARAFIEAPGEIVFGARFESGRHVSRSSRMS